MIVEAHSHVRLHLGVEEPSYTHYAMQTDNVDSYLSAYDRNGVGKCFVFGLRGFQNSGLIKLENDALAKLREDYPARLFPWGTVNPAWPEKELRTEVRRIGKYLKLYGVKLVPIVQGVAISSPGVDIVAEEAQDLDLPIFFHDGSPEYCTAIQVVYFARKYTDVRVISGHGGLRELWPELIPAARELPNLHVCLSGPTQWGIQKLYDEIGPEKLMFGSDGGLGHPAVIAAYLRRIERLNAPQEHKQMILGINAMRFLFGEG